MPREKSSTTAAPAELMNLLPGEASADEALVDEVVVHVNQVYMVKGLETAREIGEYLLARFFEGDPEKFHNRGRKHASFRKLAERDDLEPSYSFLWNACAVVEQLRLLPVDIRGALSFSHHKLLLPVKDEATKLKLAQKAVDKGLSKRALEAEVKKARKRQAGDTKAGRPPLPVFVKGLTRLSAAVKLATSEEVTKDAFATYSPSKAMALLTELDAQVAALQALRSKVEAAAMEWERSTTA